MTAKPLTYSSTTYRRAGKTYPAIAIPWADLAAAGLVGDGRDEALISAALVAAGAPDAILTTSRGVVDPQAYRLLGPACDHNLNTYSARYDDAMRPRGECAAGELVLSTEQGDAREEGAFRRRMQEAGLRLKWIEHVNAELGDIYELVAENGP